MKEKLQEYALIAEIISALAVVAGLIFVGLQIQQSTDQAALNTRALEAAAYQDLISQILEINTTTLVDKELAAMVRASAFGANMFTTGNLDQFTGYAVTVSRHADMACFQYQQGLIDEERLSGAMAIFMNVIWSNESARQLAVAATENAPGLDECIETVMPYFERE